MSETVTVSMMNTAMIPLIEGQPVQSAAAVAQTPSPAAPPTIPTAFAQFVDEKNCAVIDSKKAPNKELIVFLSANATAKFKLRFPSLPTDFVVKFEVNAQTQLLMLVRILYVSALEKGLSNVSSVAGNLHLQFAAGSIERDAWSWYAGVVGIRESCATIQASEVPVEIMRIAEVYTTAEAKATALPGTQNNVVTHSDRMVESALFAVIDAVSRSLIDFWSMQILLGKKTKLKVSGIDLSSILHAHNHGPQPTPLKFYEDLYAIGVSFETIKKALKAKEAAEKPPKMKSASAKPRKPKAITVA